ncbi:MAG: ATP-binding protein [Candidatus Paceibacterota bacterium]
MTNKIIEHIDITPDKSIFHKIGEANYSIPDAIAELVDNSIDAINNDGVDIVIALDKKQKKITISDNGIGMDKNIAAKALVLANSSKKDSLGEFGLGLKSACTSLGKRFKLTTTPKGSEEAYVLTYDRDEFMKNGSWTSFPIDVDESKKDVHGTSIEITDLRVKLYDALITRIKKDLSLRYGPFIKNNGVVIRVGLSEKSAKKCEVIEPELNDDGKKEFEFILSSGDKIYGWWGLMKKASGVRSGFDLFRRGRLIRASEKLGYNTHPMMNHVIGEINLDPVPVTHNKREFITESGEFREFIEKFWGDKTAKLVDGERIKGLIDEIMKVAHSQWNEEKVEKQLPDVTKDAVRDNVLRALNRVDEFQELAFPSLSQQKKRSDYGEDGEMEERAVHNRVATEEPDITESKRENDKRTPKKTKPQMAKFIKINGKKFRFDFEFRDLDDETIDKEIAVDEKGIQIYINTGFRGFMLSKDTSFYSVIHLAEALAMKYVEEGNLSAGQIFNLRNKLMIEVASIVLEEEELKRINKREAELKELQEQKSGLEQKMNSSKL